MCSYLRENKTFGRGLNSKCHLKKCFKFACVKQQVRDISTCNFSSWEYRTQCSNDFLYFSYVRISEREEIELFIDFSIIINVIPI